MQSTAPHSGFLFFSFLGALLPVRTLQHIMQQHKAHRGAAAVYESAEARRLQIAGPDLPAPCQLIGAFQKSRGRGTMERLTPPSKKRGD